MLCARDAIKPQTQQHVKKPLFNHQSGDLFASVHLQMYFTQCFLYFMCPLWTIQIRFVSGSIILRYALKHNVMSICTAIFF